MKNSRREFLRRTALGLVAGCGLSPRSADAESVVKPFGDAVVIAGKPRDRGRAYGRRFEPAIREFLDREIYGPFVSATSTKDALLRYAGACMGVIRSECPIIADELEGMAEGTGLRLEEHVLMTLHEELYHRGNLPPISHCTAVAVGPKETAGATFVGQTWDWMASVAGLSSLVEWRREDGPSVLAYGYPGLWVGAGLNSAGVALCWTSADLGKPNQQPRVGIPSYVLLTHLLYQPNLDAVVEAARRNRQAGWFTFVIGDGNGRLLNVEGSPESVACEEATGRLIRVGFGSREMAGEGAERHARCVSMDSLLDGMRARTDLAAMKQNFGDPARGICVGKGTIDMMVFDTTAREAHLSRGPEYGERWRTFGFAERA
jgi:hypothetical protein